MQFGQDIIPENWLEVQAALFGNSWNDKINRFRSNFVYRGTWSKDFELNTSISRLGSQYDVLEPHILRNFRKYAHSNTTQGDSVWNWLAIAQHHGLPTRLLDWTYSPLVALHFATQDLDKYNEDGVVWCINYVKSGEHLPSALKSVLEEEGSNVFTPEMLQPVSPTLKALSSFQEKEFVLFLEPPSIDNRIVHQYALFSLMSNVKAEMSNWLKQHKELYYRVIIPASLKWEIRDKLDQANITERVLTPGLSGLSAWLKRHYTHQQSIKEDPAL
ncbi:FRG domain-containing protein [Pontibacter arcticus]|uniref:FRG domain-containing protein n=1 Tax=Pontibacter arcticus TaxID=2080288 RepID=A0A364RCD9_9BACT|nr:FRG domain-containing protein [Pontibacter arcticus]RAU81943.1 FRG domain-containing protein [Pontibacter arcticus]